MSHLEEQPNTQLSRRELLKNGLLLGVCAWALTRGKTGASETPLSELEASYSYTFETVTNENKETVYPDYDIGENIATITVSKNGKSYPNLPRIQASVGMNWLIGGIGANSINTTWFNDGIFDKNSFTPHVATPIIESIGDFLDGVSTTAAIVNL